MAGLLAWAADVVGGGGSGRSDDENDPDSIPLIFTPEQLAYAQELDRKSASLNRSIQDLRLRLPPPDISQRLPDLHAHSLASNNALALQLNAHSATKQQTQLREIRLQEENAEYQKAISNCETKIQEKLQEAGLLRSKLKELDSIEESLKAELQRAEASMNSSLSGESNESPHESKSAVEAQEAEASKSALMEELENKKKELASIERTVQDLEKRWQQVQDNAMKQPTPAQREKTLDKQLHSSIEQLAAKQSQAEGLISEIRVKELELEKLNGIWRRIENGSSDMNMARIRTGKSASSLHSDYSVDSHYKLPLHTAVRNESLQRLMLLRSAFVLYILVLHVLVFIKISF
ncbi:formation of crista junctions protein 1 [Striga asiatica]|uniref:Formation of crista junctions protein 1 n=1 Tax=Striga asiatica TaxID=4170 RepID=A0A5A7PSU1_STRAF|nr:formation of crista junctions protein 1 [Striga asiatica]